MFLAGTIRLPLSWGRVSWKSHHAMMAERAANACAPTDQNLSLKPATRGEQILNHIAYFRMDEGLRIWQRCVTPLRPCHRCSRSQPLRPAAEVVDVIQPPSVASNGFVTGAGNTGAINVKRVSFCPMEMHNVAGIMVQEHPDQLCERGTSFGYNTLVNDFRLETMGERITGIYQHIRCNNQWRTIERNANLSLPCTSGLRGWWRLVH